MGTGRRARMGFAFRAGGRALLLLLAGGAFLPAMPARAGDEGKEDPVVGDVNVAVPPKKAEPKEANRLAEMTGGFAEQDLDWHEAYVLEPTGTLSDPAKATLAVATTKGYDRAAAVHDLKQGGERTKRLYKNLDVGRHEALKHLYHRAMVVANQDLASRGLSPLSKVMPVNAGGTGDYSRDQDITVFAGDEVREKAYFDALVKVARDELGLEVVPKETGGFDMPQIEVTLFPGQNDLPDARFATDVEEFHLKYRTAIEKQQADPEAYKGGGADIEVKGRRKPGQMYVQLLEWVDGKPRYVAETPQNFREAKSLFQGTAPERFLRFERAAHAFSDFIQGFQHSQGEHHDLTKGPLKYSGRSIDQVCDTWGFKPWAKLQPQDRLALLHRIWPQYDPKTPYGEKMLERIGAAIDVGAEVKGTKKVPGGVNAEEADAICLIFMRRAVAATAGECAATMLDPPAFDPKEMRKQAGPAWDKMTAVERHRYAKEKDALYRACVGRAGMENLLVLVSMLRQLDVTPDGKPSPVRLGEDVIRTLLERADPKTRPLIELASEYAEVRARSQRTADPKVREECRVRMEAIRKRLVAHIPNADGTTPGEKILQKAARTKPQAFVKAETEGKGRLWSPEALELKARFEEHLKEAFPSHAEEWKRFREHVDEVGVKGYVAKRLFDEAFQLDTLSDGLTLVEMYQGDASVSDYAGFLAVNLVSRVHWGVGPLVQAFQVYDKDPEKAAEKARELGKSLVFQTLARVVPWAATAKVVFDVARGVVTVTVGWEVSKANAQIVDALYTGEAGRTDESAKGTARGALRESGFSILSEAHVIRAKDPETGALSIAIDRGAVYRDFFRRWTGLAPDDVPRDSTPGGDVGAFVAAHDAFVKILERQAEQHGPTWVRTEKTPFVPFVLLESDVEAAIKALDAKITERCAAEAARAMDESGVRAWKRYGEDASDTRHEELTRRFAADFFSGMIEHWQTALTAQILAARDIERAAALADQSALAEALAEALEPREGRLPGAGGPPRPPPPAETPVVAPTPPPPPPGSGGAKAPPPTPAPAPAADVGKPAGTSSSPPAAAPAPTFALDVKVEGVEEDSGAGVDGGEGVRVSAVLSGTGEVSDAERPVKIVVDTAKLSLVSRAEPEPGAPDSGAAPPEAGKVGAGDLAEDKVVVRAVAAGGSGPELARVETTIRVRLPKGDRSMKVVLRRHEDRRRDGSLWQRYTYVRRFDGMPDDWVVEGGEVYHGEFETFTSDGKTRQETRRYKFGTLDGDTELFDSKGRLARRIPYVAGEMEGLNVAFDPDDPASRLEVRYEKGVNVEQTAYGKGGVRLAHITYVRDPRKEGEWPTESGSYETWWTNGNPKWKGAYAKAAQDHDGRGEPDGQRVPGKVGRWQWSHKNGRLFLFEEYVAGEKTGPTEKYDEDGKPIWKGAFLDGKREGVWEDYEQGFLRWRRGYKADVPHGIEEEYDPTDHTLRSRGTREEGKRTGPLEDFYSDGKVFRRAAYKAGDLQGAYVELFRSGKPSLETAYVGNRQNGVRKQWVEVRGGATRLETEATYVDDKLNGPSVEYYASGGKHWAGSYADDEKQGAWIEYWPVGTEKTRGSFAKGKQDGEWPVFGADGRLAERTHWKAGERDGRWESYDHKGRVTFWTVYSGGKDVDHGQNHYKD